MQPTPLSDSVVSKGEFARLLGVTPARVSQMISQGKIGADALEGEGRSAKVRVATARAQLRRNLDIGQRLGNGINTRLADGEHARQVAPPTPAPEPIAPVSSDGFLEEQIKREKLRAAQYANRKAAEDEEVRRGRLVDTAATTALMTAIAATMLQTFEASLADLATAVAGKFEIPQRDVLHLLRTEFRTVREKAAAQERRRSAGLPETISATIGTGDAG